MCVCYHLISETTRFCYQDWEKLLMDGMELQKLCCKNISLWRYGSFNGLVVLCPLELLTSAEKLQKQTMQFNSCTYIMGPATSDEFPDLFPVFKEPDNQFATFFIPCF